MAEHFTLLWQPDDALLNAARAMSPDSAESGKDRVILLTQGPPRETVDRKAVGAFLGVVFNDLAAQVPLLGRGAVIADHVDLALHAAGWGGPQGLAGLRWQGAIAVMHVAQRTCLVARDLVGVGGLYWAEYAGGQVWTTLPEPWIRLGVSPRLVPPGMMALVGPRGAQWQHAPSSPENRAWFRDLPTELQEAQAVDWLGGLRARIDAAVAATERSGLQLVREAAEDRVGRWLELVTPLGMPPADPSAVWSLAGADAWLGLDSREITPPVQGPWPEPEPPEPQRADASVVRARRLRAGWLVDVALEGARATARANGQWLVAPHLDPAVLAWLGAVPSFLPARWVAGDPQATKSGGQS